MGNYYNMISFFVFSGKHDEPPGKAAGSIMVTIFGFVTKNVTEKPLVFLVDTMVPMISISGCSIRDYGRQ
jgi:hypothetical protein